MSDWTDVFLQALELAAGLAAARFLLVATLNLFGVFDPAWYHRTLLIPWRPFGTAWFAIRRWKERVFTMGRRASARWTTVFELWTHPFKPGQLFLGKTWAFGLPGQQPIGIKTQRHACVIAAAGTGKTVHVATQIALHTGAYLVVDPKGQLAAILAPANDALVLDPYEIVPGNVRRVSWNPWDELDAFIEMHGPDSAVRFTAKIGESWIPTAATEHQKYFPDSAREFGSALYLLMHGFPKEQRTLAMFRELLTRGYRKQNKQFSISPQRDQDRER